MIRALLFIALLSGVVQQLRAAESPYTLVRALMSAEKSERRKAADVVIAEKKTALVPAMVDALFYTPQKNRNELVTALKELTGETAGTDYYEWVEILGRRTDIRPPADYLQWKVELLSKIDTNYQKLLPSGVSTRIRLEEVVWGGVKFDGIPTLQHPPHIPASEANYLQDSEKVFALEMNGQSRAYPLRILSWHEMTNDVLAGEPLTISY